MPTPTKGPRLGSTPTHQRMMLGQLASQLFEHGSITTTVTKAKRMRPLAEKLITFAKRGDLHARRQVMRVVKDKGVVHTLFTDIAGTMAEREGGYTRITKIGNRKGDQAPMAVISLVTEPLAKKKTIEEAEAATKRAVKEEQMADEAKATDVTSDPAAGEATMAAEAGQDDPSVVAEGETPADPKASADEDTK